MSGQDITLAERGSITAVRFQFTALFFHRSRVVQSTAILELCFMGFRCDHHYRLFAAAG